jgi:hypothetical protein
MRLAEYEHWFQTEYSAITLGPHCTEAGPFIDWKVAPNKPPWKMEWAIIFDDGTFLRVTENWWRRKPPFQANNMGVREHFSFQYGIAGSLRDQHGIPVRDNSCETFIRIDCDIYGPHLHYGGDDHIHQSRVDGFHIASAEPFDFVRAILRHKETGEKLATIFNFTVRPRS